MNKLNFSILVLLFLVSFVNGVSFNSGPSISNVQLNLVNFSWTTTHAANYSICLSENFPIVNCDIDKSENNYELGPFNVQITELTPDTTYYYFINITNSTGDWANKGNETQYNFTTLDNTPPVTPDDFEAEYVFDGTREQNTDKVINLTWTAVGDNGMMKNASKYYFAWSQSTINTITDFNNANIISNNLVPAENGTQDYFEISDNSTFTDGIYYFAIIVEDDNGNNASVTNASVYIDKQKPQPPKLWWNYDYYVTNESSINVYGFSDENWSEIEIYAVSVGDPNTDYTNKTTITQYNTTFEGNSTVLSITPGENEILIPRNSENLCPNFASDNNYLDFENHNRTYLLYYDITNVEEASGSRCRITISPQLESPVFINEKIKFFNNSKPNGWFNVSISLFENINNITANTIDYLYNGWSEESNVAKAVYDNNIAPQITQEYIQEQIDNNHQTIYFNISDNSKINLTTLNITLQNSTNNFWYGIEYQNLTCQNTTLFDNEFNCNIYFENLNIGEYDFNISIKDIFGNENLTQYKKYYKIYGKPIITQINDAGTLHTYNDDNTTFYFNWTMIPPFPNVIYYNYSIGTAKYPNNGWNNVKSNEIFDSENTTNNSNYHEILLDFSGCNGFCHPAHNQKYYLTLQVTTSQGTSDIVTTDGIIFIDDDEPKKPKINILDVFNSSFLDTLEPIRFNYSSQDYSGISEYEIIISKEKYLPSDGTTYLLEENKVYHNIISQEELILYELNLLQPFEQAQDYHIHVRAKDNVNLWGEFGIKTFKVDTTPVQNVSITLTQPNANPYKIEFETGFDPESGILEQELIVETTKFENNNCNPSYTTYIQRQLTPTENNAQINLREGYCHRFSINSINRAGISELTYGYWLSNNEIKYDTTPPTIPNNIVINNGAAVTNINTDLMFSFEKSEDSESGIKNYEYKLEKETNPNTNNFTTISLLNFPKIFDAGPVISEDIDFDEYDFKLQDNNRYRIKVRAYNNFNNSPSEWGYSEPILYLDNTPPIIKNVSLYAFDELKNPYFDNSIAIYNLTTNNTQIKIETFDDDLKECRYSKSQVFFSAMDVPNNSSLNDDSFTFNVTLDEGYNDLFILCSDLSDNKMDIWDAYRIKTRIDSLPPNITISQPENNKTFGKKIQFLFNADDSTNEIDKMWYEVYNRTDGNIIFPKKFSTGSGIVEFNSSFDDVLENMSLIFFANDTWGNVGNKTLNFTFDGRLPTIVLNEPISDTNQEFLLNLTIENANFYNITIKYLQNENLIWNKTQTNISNIDWNITQNINPLEEGIYMIEIFAQNKHGLDDSINKYNISYNFIFDNKSFFYENLTQKINEIEINETYNTNNTQINLSVDWFELITENVSQIDYINFNITTEIKGINKTEIKNTGQNSFYILNQNELNPGSTIYWFSEIWDKAGNYNKTEIKKIKILNTNISKENYYLKQIYYSYENKTINLSQLFNEEDFNSNISYYINSIFIDSNNYQNISQNNIFNYTVNPSINQLNFSYLDFGTDYLNITISDGYSNVTHNFNITYTNHTNLKINSSYNLSLTLTTDTFKNIIENKNIYGKNININISKGLTNITHQDEKIFFKLYNISKNNLTRINISVISSSDFEQSQINFNSNHIFEFISGNEFFILNTTVNNSLFGFLAPTKNYKIVSLYKNSTGYINYTNSSVTNPVLIDNKYYVYDFNQKLPQNIILLFEDKGAPSSPIGGSSPKGGSNSGSSPMGGGFSPAPKQVEENNTQEEIDETEDKEDTQIIFKEDEETQNTQNNNNNEIEQERETIREPNLERPEDDFITIDIKPIITGLIFIMIISTIVLIVIKKPFGQSSMSLKEKVEYYTEKNKQKHMNTDMLNYLNYAVENNFNFEDAKNKLIQHGFEKEEVEKHINHLVQKNTDITRIRNYLESKWDDEKIREKALNDINNVGWPKEYIQKAVNDIIEKNNKI